MADPAAVPGVDPSGVNTPDELAACLDGLRRRRGLSYEVMEKAAAKLSSRPGRSRLEPLPKSTVGEIVTGKRLPAKGKLLTFLTVCQVAAADLAQWLAAWERASTAHLARPASAVRVRAARPRLLGVHAAISVPGAPDDVDVPPHYVLRDVDAAEFGIRARVEAAAQGGGFVLLVGGSSVGKTRCAFEAVKTLLPEWWLVHPDGPGEVAMLAAASPGRTVVWLDEVQRYLDGEDGLTGAVVRTLLNAPDPIVIIGTLWPDRYAAYTAVPAPGGEDPYAREREVLDLAAVIRVGPEFSPAEQDRARAAARRDQRVALALSAAGYGLTQTLAAAPQLVDRWEGARDGSPYGWAVLTAALDAARLGARAPLSADLLREAAPGYCTSAQQAEAPGNWFEQALAYATAGLHGAAAALSPAGSGMGQIAGYTPADYLVQHATRERRPARVPASAWDALLNHLRDPADAARLADSARGRLLYRYAIPLYRHAVDASNQAAAFRLAALLEEQGDLEGLRARADAGDRTAARRLADLLAKRGDPVGAADILRAAADGGNPDAARRLAKLLQERGDLNQAEQFLRAAADGGDRAAPRRLADLLAKRGDLDGLRARAVAGDGTAAWRLAGLLEERGDLDGVIQLWRAVADGGNADAAWRLADLLRERGDLDELRARADAGDQDAAGRLADLLRERGDLDELRARADAGDGTAAKRLAELLGVRGDLDGLRARADVGDGIATFLLANLLRERGDLDGAVDILRAAADGGNPDAARWLADLLAKRGDLDGLRARADAGDQDAARWLADLLAKRGGLDGVIQLWRARADGGDQDAARQLVRLLEQRGDLDGLRARADAGDQDAAWRLADLLAKRGDLDGVIQLWRARADAGDGAAAGRLAALFEERGELDGAVDILRAAADAGNGDARRLADLLIRLNRGEEAEQLRRFGLNPDGSIARAGNGRRTRRRYWQRWVPRHRRP